MHAAKAPFPNLRAGYYDDVDPATSQPAPSHPHWTDAMLAYDTSNLKDFISHCDAYTDTLPLAEYRRTNAANAPDYVFNTFHTDRVRA